LVLAVVLLPVGVIMTWVGVGTLREQWILRRRGVKVPAVAERWLSQAGSFGVYRFLDGQGQTRLANADKVRTIPAAEVEIVYDPKNSTVARERFWLAEVAIGVVSLFTGIVVTATAVVTVVLGIIAFS